MQVDRENLPQPIEATAPFALIIGDEARVDDPELLIAFGRMGLQPELWPQSDENGDAAALIDAPVIRLNFGGVAVLAGWSNAQAMDHADPLDPLCSNLAGAFPEGWQKGRRCLSFVPLGGPDALAGGLEQGQTQLREFFKMMVLLIDLFGGSHLYWSPARLWSDAAQFRSAIAEMMTSGMPPVLHLVAFRLREDGEGQAMVTRGLAHFCGQELAASMPTSWSSATAVKRLARIALDMMINGPIRAERRYQGLEPGEWVSITPFGEEEGGANSMAAVVFSRSD